ncbi:MAG TPA: DNA polymerase III subunit beta [Candidatus Omnitrophota bacterium]|nr:DNA polymerase III subunit beta [Candidatus Omnitrophota bacterium]
MKLRVEKESFLKAIGSISGAVSQRSTMQILSNILIETVGKGQVRLTGTDLELGIVCTTSTEVLEEGSITIPAKKIHDIIKELPQGAFELVVAKNNTVTIKNEKSYFKLVGLPKDDFPKLPEPQKESSLEIEQKQLKECLNLTNFAVSHDETRYVLNGVLCLVEGKAMKIVATDGRRLAYVKKELPGAGNFKMEAIIPTKTVQELGKILGEQGTVKITPVGNQIIFSVGEIQLISRLIEGHFPNYEQVIPKEEKVTAKLDCQKFLSAVRRASLLTSPEAQAVKLDVTKNKLLISSRSPNLGESREEVDSEVKGDDIVIGFNPSYLIDVLRNIGVETVEVSFSNPDKPAVMRGKEGYLCVIMPMQLN